MEAGDVAGVAGGTLSIAMAVWFLLTRAIRRGDVAEEARIVHCEKAIENHRDKLDLFKEKLDNLQARMEFREGKYGVDPLTNPGMRPTPELLALIAKKKAEGESK